jgi:hypothetical protein
MTLAQVVSIIASLFALGFTVGRLSARDNRPGQ